MPNFANVTIAGHLGSDPELGSTAKGTDACKFSVAVNTGFGDNKKTTWYSVRVYGKRAASAAEHLSKGSAVLINGEPELNEYNGKTYLNVTANSWSFAGGKPQAAPKSAPSSAPTLDDDLPF